jgi:hypothetical protein
LSGPVALPVDIPEDTRKQVLAFGDNWDRKLVKEQELRKLHRQ